MTSPTECDQISAPLGPDPEPEVARVLRLLTACPPPVIKIITRLITERDAAVKERDELCRALLAHIHACRCLTGQFKSDYEELVKNKMSEGAL